MKVRDAALVARHRAPLTSYMRSLVDSPPIAADIVQETWERAIPSLRSGTVENVRAFLYRVARNLATDHARAENVHRAVITADEVPAHVADAAPLPDRVLLGCEALAQLHAAVDELGERCREVLVLRRMDGLSAAEIAERLGISRQMVSRYLSQAMDHCLDRLEDDA